MKRIFATIFIIFSAILFCTTVYCQDVASDITSSISKELSDFKNALPDCVLDYIPSEGLDGNYDELLSGEINERSLLELSVSYLFSGIDTVLKSFGTILAIIIIISIFNTMAIFVNII